MVPQTELTDQSGMQGTWFSCLILKLLVYMHGIVHIAYACELL